MSFYRFDVSSDQASAAQPFHITNTETPAACSRFSIEVQDNGDGRLDERDRYVLRQQDRSQLLQSREALRALNYYLNPENLRHDHLQIGLSRSETALPLLVSRPVLLSQSGIFTAPELSAIEHSSSAWFMDGHLDLSLLEGARTFTRSEIDAWTARPGHFPYGRFLASEGGAHLMDSGFVLGDWNRWWGGHLSWADMRIGQISEKVLIGFTFGALSAASGANLVWHLFTGNYTSNELGRIFANQNAEAQIQALSQNTESPTLNLASNVRVVEVQNERAQRNLYFGFTEPIIALACAADRDFWRWLFQVPRLTHYGEYSMIGAYARNFAESFAALFGEGSASVSGLRALGGGALIYATSFLSLYELTQIWYESYGSLTYRSRENRIASLVSTLFSQTWLLSRTGRQLSAITGSSTFTLRNLAQARVPWTEMNFQLLDLIRDFSRNFPLFNLITRRLMNPSLGELARNLQQSAQNLREVASRREILEAIQSGERARSLFQNLLYRLSPNLYQGYMSRELASASESLLKNQNTLLRVAENVERQGANIRRFGPALQAVQNAVQAARALVTNSAPVLAPEVTGLTENLGATLARGQAAVNATIRSGGFPQVVEEVESAGVEAMHLARGAANVVRSSAVQLEAAAVEVMEEVAIERSALTPALQTASRVTLTGARSSRPALVGGGGAAMLIANTGARAMASAALTSALSSAETAGTALVTAAGVKVGLLVAGSFTVGAGIGTGIAYATGIYDEHYSPRDAWNDFIPSLRYVLGRD